LQSRRNETEVEGNPVAKMPTGLVDPSANGNGALPNATNMARERLMERFSFGLKRLGAGHQREVQTPINLELI